MPSSILFLIRFPVAPLFACKETTPLSRRRPLLLSPLVPHSRDRPTWEKYPQPKNPNGNRHRHIVGRLAIQLDEKLGECQGFSSFTV
jgi:hypothetical protein